VRALQYTTGGANQKTGTQRRDRGDRQQEYGIRFSAISSLSVKTEAALLGKAIHYTLKSLFREPAGVEVEKQADRATGKAEVREQLCRMDSLEPFHGLDFDDHEASDDEVKPIPAIESLIFIDDRQRLLTFETEPPRGEFERQTGRVRMFEQARSKLVVNFQCSPDDRLSECVQLLFHTRSSCKDRARRTSNARTSNAEIAEIAEKSTSMAISAISVISAFIVVIVIA